MNTTRVRGNPAPHSAPPLGSATLCPAARPAADPEYVARRTGIKAEVIDRIEIGKGNVAWGDLLALIDFYGWRFDFNPEKDEKTA